MLKRKIEKYIEEYLRSDDERILYIDGARQIGKSFIIRHVCNTYFDNFVEINLSDDKRGDRLFEQVNSVESFYIQLSILAGDKLDNRNNTIVFLDEIQEYPQLLGLLKALRYDNRYRYICSGSLLGVTLKKTSSIPMGSIIEKRMYQLDFEEFLWANGVGQEVLTYLRKCYETKESVEESTHNKMMQLFKTYLYVGGLPDCVNEYVSSQNIYRIKETQRMTKDYYADDASKYDEANKLKVSKIYNSLTSTIDNKVKRIQYIAIEDKKNANYDRYASEFEYLVSSGIVYDVQAISEPKFPLSQSVSKRLVKLYYNDIGILTYELYRENVNAILQDKSGVNLGAVYETVVGQELKAHGHDLYYFDKRKIGEVDFVINDYENLTIKPIEVKSGKDYTVHSALNKMLSNENYKIAEAIVLSNSAIIEKKEKRVYLPIYMVMFI